MRLSFMNDEEAYDYYNITKRRYDVMVISGLQLVIAFLFALHLLFFVFVYIFSLFLSLYSLSLMVELLFVQKRANGFPRQNGRARFHRRRAPPNRAPQQVIAPYFAPLRAAR